MMKRLEIPEKAEEIISRIKASANEPPQKLDRLMHDLIRLESAAIPAIIKALERLSESEWDKALETNFMNALASMKSDKSVNMLINILQSHPDDSARVVCVISLGEIKSNKALEPLTSALKTDSSIVVRQYAAQALGMFGDDSVISLLSDTMDNAGELRVRLGAVQGLFNLNTKNAHARLMDALRTSKEPDLRFAIISSYGQMQSSESLDSLIYSASNDSSINIRTEALFHLANIAESYALSGKRLMQISGAIEKAKNSSDLKNCDQDSLQKFMNELNRIETAIQKLHKYVPRNVEI